MVRPDSIAPNDVQILMPLVSGLTAEIVFWHTLGLESRGRRMPPLRTRSSTLFSAEALICFDGFFIN